jgi:hypothetical protein
VYPFPPNARLAWFGKTSNAFQLVLVALLVPITVTANVFPSQPVQGEEYGVQQCLNVSVLPELSGMAILVSNAVEAKSIWPTLAVAVLRVHFIMALLVSI